MLATSARAVVLEAVKKCHQEYPNISFVIDYTKDSDLDKYDLIITDNMAYSNKYEEIELITEKIVLAISDKNPLSEKDKIKIDDLREQKFITLCQNNALYHITKKICNFKDFEPNVSIFCEEKSYISDCVKSDMGISLVPMCSWKKYFSDGMILKEIEDIPESFAKKRTLLLYGRERYISRAAKLFIDILVNTAKEYEA